MTAARTRNQAAQRLRKRLFLISPGPKYDIVNDLQLKLTGLAEQFEGIVFTATPKPARMTLGNFLIVTVRIRGGRTISYHFRFFLAGILMALKERIKQNRINLVVSYDPLMTGLLGLVVSRILNAKFITEVNGEYANIANYADEKRKVRAWLKIKAYTVVQRFILKHADGIKTLYPGQVDRLKVDLTDKVIDSFFNLVDLERFKNLGEETTVLFAGFPLYRKGVDVLIRAFKKISAKYPQWKLKILGWFPDVEELNAEIGGHPQIFHHRPVPSREMPNHIGTCALFVLPSRSEAMGRVLLEAMAAGKPRIGANVGGIPTVITHGHDGFLFESENVAQLAQCLDKLMGNAALRARMGKAAKNRAKREFSAEQYFKRIAEFYAAVLAQ
jgi:glycosyltransferase involved in cell wall biosynthesis